MSIAVKCPQCQKEHHVDDSMAGTQAKCGCGHVLTVPHNSQRFAEITCPSCGQRFRADESMFGTSVECSCGGVMRIRDPRIQTKPPENVWDELPEEPPDPKLVQMAWDSLLPEEQEHLQGAAVYTEAIKQLHAGVSSNRIIDSLVRMGVPHNDAADAVRQVAPRGYSQRIDNRAGGRKMLASGALIFLFGCVFTLVVLLLVPLLPFVIAGLVIAVVGMFRFGVGLIAAVTGAR